MNLSIRIGIVLALLAVSGYLLNAALFDFVEWRKALVDDPSAAESYEIEFWLHFAPGLVLVFVSGALLRK